MRTEPAPSEPCAIGRSPAATAAPAPPLEPPEVRSRSHGLRVGGCRSGSVTGIAPSSEVAVLPTITKPPRRSDAVVLQSTGDGIQTAREPKRATEPRTKFRSFTAVGTP